MVAEQVLAHRAGGDQADPQVGQVDQREGLDERVERALEAAGGGERAGERDEQAEPPAGVDVRVMAADRDDADGRGPVAARRRAQQPQRGLEPARGDRRGARGGLVAGLLEHRGGRLVAHPRRALDVVGARRQGAGPVGERRRGTRVGLQPPRLAGPVVDRAADERMAEAVAPRHVGRRRRCWRRSSSSIAASASGSSIPAAAAARSRSNGSPATAAPQPSRRAPSGRPPISWPSAAATAGGTPTRSPSSPGSGSAGAGAACQLLQVERVAAALAVEDGQRRRAEQRVGLGLGQRPEPDLGHEPVAAGGLERGQHAVRHASGTEGERDQHRRRRRPPQQVGDQLERGVVGPVDVVEHEQDRMAGSPAARAARAPRGRRGSARPGGRRLLRRTGRGQHARQLAHALADQRLERALAERGDVIVERVDPDRERQLALELGPAAHEHRVAALGGAVRKLTEQPRLADPRLAADDQPAGAPAAHLVECLVHRRQLLAASYESLLLHLRYRRHFRFDPNRPPAHEQRANRTFHRPHYAGGGRVPGADPDRRGAAARVLSRPHRHAVGLDDPAAGDGDGARLGLYGGRVLLRAHPVRRAVGARGARLRADHRLRVDGGDRHRHPPRPLPRGQPPVRGLGGALHRHADRRPAALPAQPAADRWAAARGP